MKALLDWLFAREPAWLPTAEQLAAHWRVEPPKPFQIEMLRANLRALDRKIHPADMTRAMGWENANAANLHYGAFASETTRVLGIATRGRMQWPFLST